MPITKKSDWLIVVKKMPVMGIESEGAMHKGKERKLDEQRDNVSNDQ